QEGNSSTATGNPSSLFVSGNTNVAAISTASATTTPSVGSGGAVSVGALASTARIGNTANTGGAVYTHAYLGDGTVVGNAAKRSGSLIVTATATDQASNSAVGGSGGLATRRRTHTEAFAAPDVAAYAGSNVSANLTGSVDVEATSTRAEADATAKSFGGGGIDVGVPLAKAYTTPTVTGYVGSGSNITADGGVTVNAV